VTVQSYLHRAADDIARLASRGAFVRLVKGAFAEPAIVAVRTRKQIDSRFRQAVATLMSPSSLAAGTYVAFGTHDDVIIEEICNVADQNGWASDRYEFEMLYGVRPELHAELVSRGLKVRLYVPFGRDWFPYAMRRVGESPRNLRFAINALRGSGS
jgi:proline dehydrogenase